MWRKRQVEQAMLMEEQRAMDEYLTTLLSDGELDVDTVRHLFLQQYPGEEYYMENFISEFL